MHKQFTHREAAVLHRGLENRFAVKYGVNIACSKNGFNRRKVVLKVVVEVTVVIERDLVELERRLAVRGGRAVRVGRAVRRGFVAHRKTFVATRAAGREVQPTGRILCEGGGGRVLATRGGRRGQRGRGLQAHRRALPLTRADGVGRGEIEILRTGGSVSSAALRPATHRNHSLLAFDVRFEQVGRAVAMDIQGV